MNHPLHEQTRRQFFSRCAMGLGNLALASLLTNRAVRSNVAMTGEITLQGKVLPVGGIKDKVLAAHRLGVDTVLLPKKNENDLDDVPEEVRNAMTFVLVDMVDELLAAALMPSPPPSDDAPTVPPPTPPSVVQPAAVSKPQ